MLNVRCGRGGIGRGGERGGIFGNGPLTIGCKLARPPISTTSTALPVNPLVI